MTLFMVLLGCKPAGRNTEQHDIFFGIAADIKELVPAMRESWPEANDRIHMDAWREVHFVDGYEVRVIPRPEEVKGSPVKLFFINLGGYKKGEFEEFHYKMIMAAGDKGEAISRAKETAFYKHTGFENARSHIDDKYGVDVDDVYEIEDILPPEMKEQFAVSLLPADKREEDELHIGYFKLEKI